MDDDRRKRSKWDDRERGDRHERRERDRDHDRDRDFARDRDNERGSHRSRWDDSNRRSRSPRSSTISRPSRSRSPLRSSALSPKQSSAEPPKPAIDPAAAAAAAAARINAQIQAKRHISTVDTSIAKSTAQASPTAGKSGTPIAGMNPDMHMQDGDYIKDIEVNDLRNRYTLTKGSTQKMIKEETGADVTTRGAYFPDKAMASPQNPPLYLHITSTTKEGLDKAIEKIEELMRQELGSLVDERRFRRREPVEQVERDEFGRRKWPEERVPIDLEPIPGFNLRASVVGHQGAYVKHIQQETRCRVQIKGRGSGFMENGIGRESDETMYLHVTGPDPKEVQHAKELCEDLVKSVTEQYEQFKANPTPPRYGGYGGHGGHHQQNHNQQHYGQHQNYGTHMHQSPPPPPPPSSAPNNDSPPPPPPPSGLSPSTGPATGAAAVATDYTAQAQQYNPYAAYGQADPYAAYGGYQAYAAYYAQYYAAAQQQQAAVQAPGSNGPPGTQASPPPPPGTSYNAVKPPPGL